MSSAEALLLLQAHLIPFLHKVASLLGAKHGLCRLHKHLKLRIMRMANDEQSPLQAPRVLRRCVQKCPRAALHPCDGSLSPVEDVQVVESLGVCLLALKSRTISFSAIKDFVTFTIVNKAVTTWLSYLPLLIRTLHLLKLHLPRMTATSAVAQATSSSACRFKTRAIGRALCR